MSKLAKLNQFKRYLQNNAGSIAPIFAAAAIPFILVAGAAIDMTRISREQVTFFNSVDGAALAIAADDRAAVSGLSESQKIARLAELEAYALQYLKANYSKDEFRDGKLNRDREAIITVNLDVDGTGIRLDAEVEFVTTFMSMVGIDKVNIKADSEVRFAMKPVELVMVMDTTGSMASNSKMTGAKDAAKKLLDTLYGGTLAAYPRSEFVRTALVPFSGTVRLNTAASSDFNLSWIDTEGENPLSRVHFDGSSAPAIWNNFYAWGRLKKTTGTTAAAYHTWNGCVEARARGDSVSGTDFIANDVAPDPLIPETLFPAYFMPDMPVTSGGSASYGPNYISHSSGTPNEYTGLTSTQRGNFSTAGLRLKQENYRKYDQRVIGAESATTSGPWTNCPNAPIVPMTYDRTTVVNGIDAMQPRGPTLIAEGLAWGWRAISPGAPFTQVSGSGTIAASTIAPYNGPRWKKFMVLMTDGDNDLQPNSSNYNVSSYSAYGFAGETLATNRFGTTSASGNEEAIDTQMLAICENIKGQDITLYVTSFGSGVSPATKARLETCSTGDGYYTHSETTTDLVSFFDHIGKDVLSKSIYVAK